MIHKELDMLMVFPPGGETIERIFGYHLGSAYIITYLNKKGFKVSQFITNETHNVNECVKKIMSLKPKVVGFTVYFSNFMQSVLISNGLKAINSEIIIIFGGPTPTVNSKEILEDVASVDLCIKQEGEETLLEILTLLSQNNYKLSRLNLKNLKGISFREGSEIIVGPNNDILYSNRNIKHFIDKYPSPYITNVIPLSNATDVGIITARGCNQYCTYCNCAVLSKKIISFHSIERVIEELLYLNDIKEFDKPLPIHDDTFTMIPKRAAKICENIIDEDIKIPLRCVTRCDTVNKELMDLMKQAGFQAMGLSLESAVPRVLRSIGKVNPPVKKNNYDFKKEAKFIEKFKEISLYAKAIGIKHVFASIMIGLPGESLLEAQTTVDLINRLDIDLYTHNYLHIYRGTPLYDKHVEYGYRIKQIGKSNRIYTANSHPFNVYKVGFAKNSSTIINAKNYDYNSLKILSLNPTRSRIKPFFDNVILISNYLNPDLIKWLQANLAINGTLIQIYSNKHKFNKIHPDNEANLYDYISPTMYYNPYYREFSKGNLILISGRAALYKTNVGLPIKFKKASSALKEYKKGRTSISNVICQEFSPIDSETLFSLITTVAEQENPITFLSKAPMLPRFQNLCRWTVSNANCMKLETAIIDSDENVRLCWNSKAVGKIGESFSEIRQNIEEIRNNSFDNRNCGQCKQNNNCVKCPFPDPLSSEEYCAMVNSYDLGHKASLLEKFNIVKDIFIKPADY